MTIYFAEMGDWIKIGYTAGDPARRIAQLQTGQPQRITLLGTIAGDMDVEASLHREFSEFRGNGEWFERSGILAVVRFLIENQHPWYFCRAKLHDKVWERAFRVRPGVDLSSYDDCRIKPKGQASAALSKAFGRRLAQHRRKHGIDHARESLLRKHFFSEGIHPYIRAWVA